MRIALLFDCALWCAVAAGCARRIPHPSYSPQPSSALLEVTQPPPPARVEVLPDAPSPSALWVDGEWDWRRGRWAWVPGRWVDAPAKAAFCAWVFVRGPDGRLWYAPGIWRDTNGAPVDPPKVLAYAGVQSGAVVNADGTTELTGPTLRERPTPPATAH